METQVYQKPQEHKTILPFTKQHLQSMLGHKNINFLASVCLSRHMCSAFIALQNGSNSLQMWKDMDQKASVPRVESHAYTSCMESML